MESAIYEDCHNLVELFVNANTGTFESFCVQWKELMFQHMYSPQSNVVEVLLTTTAIYQMAKRTVCAKDEVSKYLLAAEGNERRILLRRVGGLFLMYAVYFKQPTRRYVKITVSLGTWREMILFIESLHLDPEMDSARYVFWRLYQADAFRFTALDYMVGLEGLVDYDKIGEESSQNEQPEVVRVKLKHQLNAVPELRNTLEGITKLEESYNRIKRDLNGPRKTQETNKALPPTCIFQDIKEAFNDIQDILDNTFVPQTNSKNSNGDSSKSRREIKRKAAGITDDDDYETEEDTTDEDSDESYSPCAKTNRKKIEKKATETVKLKRYSKVVGMLSQNLPDDIAKDLINASSSDDDDNDELENENEEKEEEKKQEDIKVNEGENDTMIEEKSEDTFTELL